MPNGPQRGRSRHRLPAQRYAEWGTDRGELSEPIRPEDLSWERYFVGNPRRSRRPCEGLRRGALRPPLLLGTSPRCHPRTGARQHAPVRLPIAARPRRSKDLKVTPTVLSDKQAAFLVRQRVARLATSDGMGKPHAVPVCFALTRASIFIALDEKPKDVPPPDSNASGTSSRTPK